MLLLLLLPLLRLFGWSASTSVAAAAVLVGRGLLARLLRRGGAAPTLVLVLVVLVVLVVLLLCCLPCAREKGRREAGKAAAAVLSPRMVEEHARLGALAAAWWLWGSARRQLAPRRSMARWEGRRCVQSSIHLVGSSTRTGRDHGREQEAPEEDAGQGGPAAPGCCTHGRMHAYVRTACTTAPPGSLGPPAGCFCP